MVRANDIEPPAKEKAPVDALTPEAQAAQAQHGLQGKGARKRLAHEVKEEPLVPLGIVVTALASLMLLGTSYYYRRKMARIHLDESAKAQLAIKSQLNYIAIGSAVFSAFTAIAGYSYCKMQPPPVVIKKKKGVPMKAKAES